MLSNHLLELALLVLAYTERCEAYWRMECSTAQTSRLDPIINPGAISGHAHKVSGPNTIYLNSTTDSLSAATCTTCEIQADNSAYWTPQLYYQHKDGSFEEVPNGGTVVYYLGRGDDRSAITPFPKGLMMVSGDPWQRSYDNQTLTYLGTKGGRPISDRVSYNCLNYAKPNPETPGFPTQACPQGMRAQIQFQSCWDGVNLYKSDLSHIDYLSQIDNGVCPPTHPKLLPHLFFEVIYGVDRINQDGGRFVFSQGDATGYGFHGQFMNGWDEKVLSGAVQNCLFTDNQGQISSCPDLQASHISNYAGICPEEKPIVKEPVKGTISKLPGCIKITSGPGKSNPGETTCPAGSEKATVNPPTAAQPAPVLPSVGATQGSWKFASCASEPSGSRLLTAASYTSDSMTNSACQKFCDSKHQPLAGTEYGSECYCGNSINTNALISNCDKGTLSVCSGGGEYCGGGWRLMIWNSTSTTGRQSLTRGTKIGKYAYQGCIAEGSNGRILSGASTSTANMTNDACGSFCSARGFSIFGTEYSAECYCGNSLPSGTNTDQSGCSMACMGEVAKDSPFAPYINLCGGPNRLNVFNINK